MAFSAVIALRALFTTLGCLMLLTLIYTISVDGLPFRRELLTPWMAATLVDFYVNIVAIAVWVAYKEATWVGAVLWIILLVCFGRTTMERRKFSSVLVARIIFSALGCLMFATLVYTLLTDGSPFRKELLTPWMTATLVDFYVNVVAIAVWVAYKEATWIGAFVWIVLLIGFGSITTSAYIVIQLFQLSSQDPLHLVLLGSSNRQEYRHYWTHLMDSLDVAAVCPAVK
ncbi:uncharacterized protein LOC131223452 isoform X3 [Magnolia sinica]|uniref:uncharacterized protein LOC131223452 isoform X3 n=1 Tax=Magnolia sinica TaxID=86752 RepID=UPI00265A8CAC|nr:uncharacterized protein LOC131223452 isoform X3 [Magnolia sinica]